jgi:enoyl-CoA hydratase/carnithine racemase
MRFAATSAKFTTTWPQRGLVAQHAMSRVLPRLICASKMLDLSWSARKFDGAETKEPGIADRLCEPGATVNGAEAYLIELASPIFLTIMKRQTCKHVDTLLGPAEETVRLTDENLTREDFRECVRSYIELSAPRFARFKVG